MKVDIVVPNLPKSQSRKPLRQKATAAAVKGFRGGVVTPQIGSGEDGRPFQAAGRNASAMSADDWQWMCRAWNWPSAAAGTSSRTRWSGRRRGPRRRVVGEGWHQRYGQAHAEVNALAAGRRRGRAGRRCTSRWSRAATTARRRPAPTPCSGPASAASSPPWRPVPAGRRARAAAPAWPRRVAVEVGLAEAEARRLNAPYLKLLADRPALRPRQVGHDARRQDRHAHRRLEVDQQRGVAPPGPRAARPHGRHRRRHRHGLWPTTPV